MSGIAQSIAVLVNAIEDRRRFHEDALRRIEAMPGSDEIAELRLALGYAVAGDRVFEEAVLDQFERAYAETGRELRDDPEVER